MNARPKTNPFTMTLRLPSDVAVAIDDAAGDLRTSRSNFIRHCIRRNLDYFTAVELPILQERRSTSIQQTKISIERVR